MKSSPFDTSKKGGDDGASTPSGCPCLLLLSHKIGPALKGEKARELNYTLRLRLAATRLITRTMAAIRMRR
jgi:hypothetical protein